MSKKKIIIKTFLTAFCVLAGALLANAESCTTAGQVQYKPSGTCSTSQRTCCKSGNWSDWGSSCVGADNCASDECWTGSVCSSKPPVSCSCTNGTCTRTWTCTPGSGWSYTDSSCVCKSGYVLKNGVCEAKTSCIEYKSLSYYKATCAECWNAAKAMTNNVPKCTTDTQVGCYIMRQSLGYESVSANCGTETLSPSYASGGSTSIVTMRYNHGLSSGTINCYFEGLQYRTCID